MLLQLSSVKVVFFESKSFLYFLLFASLQCLHTVAAQESTTAAFKNSDESPPDPAVALEGRCVVVCDAATLPTAQSRNMEYMGGRRRPKQLAFSVLKKDSVTIAHDSSLRLILFDHFLISVGNAYDMAKGTFKPTTNGVYSFQFTVFKVHNRHPTTVALTVNGIVKLTGFAHSTEAQHDMAHNSGLLKLSKGDIIQLVIQDGNLDGGWQHSTFSSYLLYEDDDF